MISQKINIKIMLLGFSSLQKKAPFYLCSHKNKSLLLPYQKKLVRHATK